MLYATAICPKSGLKNGAQAEGRELYSFPQPEIRTVPPSLPVSLPLSFPGRREREGRERQKEKKKLIGSGGESQFFNFIYNKGQEQRYLEDFIGDGGVVAAGDRRHFCLTSVSA